MRIVTLPHANEVRTAKNNISEFIKESVRKNRDQIAFTIKTSNESPQHIINVYSDVILGCVLAEYSKEGLLNLISSGVLFEIKKSFVEKLVEQSVIQKAIEEKVKEDQELLIY